jgi:hypothetical protein
MDYSKIKEVMSEEDQSHVNKLLRNGWILLSIEKGSILYGSASVSVFVLGRVDKEDDSRRETPKSQIS